MKQSEAAAFLPLIEAWSKGETLEIRDMGNNTWKDLGPSYVSFAGHPSRYRIKPKPVSVWVASWIDSGGVIFFSDTSCSKSGLESSYGKKQGFQLHEIVRDVG